MVVVTIESVCASSRGEFQKLLYAKKNVLSSCVSEPNYADIASVISCVVAFLNTVKNDDAIYVFPLSLVTLFRTEAYAIVMKILDASGFRNFEQLMICIDGNVNDALSEMIDNGDKVLLTLDELYENREIICHGACTKLVFSERHTLVRTTPSELTSAIRVITSHRSFDR